METHPAFLFWERGRVFIFCIFLLLNSFSIYHCGIYLLFVALN